MDKETLPPEYDLSQYREMYFMLHNAINEAFYTITSALIKLKDMQFAVETRVFENTKSAVDGENGQDV